MYIRLTSILTLSLLLTILLFFTGQGESYGGVLQSLVSHKAEVTGRVVDNNGHGVENVRVRVVGFDDFVLSSSTGRFILPLTDARLLFSDIYITAGKDGWLNGGARSNLINRDIAITLQRVPVVDSPDYTMTITSPINPKSRQGRDCANCHTTHMWEWGASKMGKVVRNKRVLGMYKDFRKSKDNGLANSCADCHAPIAALNAPGRTDLASAFKGANLSNGIECDFCHKIKKVTVSNRPGVQAIEMNRVSLGSGMMAPLLVYGPYDDVVNMPMAASYNEQFSKSDFCSSCHQDAVSLPAGQGWKVEEVYPEASKYPLYEGGRVIPNQWTYQEWLEWQDELPEGAEDKGRHCQDCHMNWTQNMMPYYRYTVSGTVRQQMGVQRTPESISPHKFEGGTPKRLIGSVDLQLESQLVDDKLLVTVGVTNVNAGHRLPTGEHTRNMILLVTAESEDGSLLDVLSGSTVPVWGGEGSGEYDYAGLPGKGFARVTAGADGTLNVPVWQATRIVSDNRIKAKATDKSSFSFALPDGADDEIYYISAKLIYRRSFPEQDRQMGWQPEEILMKEVTIETEDGDSSL